MGCACEGPEPHPTHAIKLADCSRLQSVFLQQAIAVTLDVVLEGCILTFGNSLYR